MSESCVFFFEPVSSQTAGGSQVGRVSRDDQVRRRQAAYARLLERGARVRESREIRRASLFSVLSQWSDELTVTWAQSSVDEAAEGMPEEESAPEDEEWEMVASVDTWIRVNSQSKGSRQSASDSGSAEAGMNS